MKEILIFAGTSEGRTLSDFLIQKNLPHTICVATEYGEDCLEEHPIRTIVCGRMDAREMEDFLMKQGREHWIAVVDATHPYAVDVTKNIQLAVRHQNLPYLRLKRDLEAEKEYSKLFYLASSEVCAEALEQTKGNVLLTTGTKDLKVYCERETLKSRIIARVLPGMESLSLCIEQGLHGRQIIAMQGPFTVEMNQALIQQYEIQAMVTKQSGVAGGFGEKVQAAKNADIPLYVIGQPEETEGLNFEQTCVKLLELCGKPSPLEYTGVDKFQITLAGIGMGEIKGLTVEVQQAIEEADLLLGAERMLQPFSAKVEKKPYYLAKQILPYLEQYPNPAKVVILFSGDSGFCSGTKSLYQVLQQAVEEERLSASVHILPGISSVSYMAAKTGESYEDAEVLSMHGKQLFQLVRRIQSSKKLYLLVSGVEDVQRLGQLLLDAGLSDCEITTGYQLSYKEENIIKRTPKECTELKDEGLYICLIKNPNPIGIRVTPGYPDGEFLRAKVPMTKEEVREVSLCKLRLKQESVCVDIGSGTGSIAVEMACLSPKIQVYALEQKEEAVALIQQNKEKFLVDNLYIIHGKAPDGLEQVPKATHAFIGGSGGNLRQILQALYEKNPKMRVVLNAISLETISEIQNIFADVPCCQQEIVQLQVSRSREVGSYHLMQAENPIWICAFTFCEREKS